MQGVCVLGNQLFPNTYMRVFTGMPVFMAEDHGLCTYFRFHKHKLVLFLSAMRHYKDELESYGFAVTYHQLPRQHEDCYETKLGQFITQNQLKTLHMFEVEDHFMAQRLEVMAKKQGIELKIHSSPMFTCSRKEFAEYLQEKNKPFMKSFYERQRKTLNILMESGKPEGGRYSFDADNRQKIPKNHVLPKIKATKRDMTDTAVIELVAQLFPDHPGQSEAFWQVTTRAQALTLLKDFLQHRIHNFGRYQDAILAAEGFLHHSLIATSLNLGLLTPAEVVAATLKAYRQNNLPLASVEGFIRQIIGWREFVRGIYHHFSENIDQSNFWQAQRKMRPCWYEGNTGLPPLDDCIRRAIKTSYSHHIERLMILANLMNLCELHPKQVYSWFMEMYADSSDWVMAANVYGMGLMSDGGIFATKPYISGSNYIIKMSDYKKGPWCEIWDGLYWRFVEKHQDFFQKNPRMRMMTRTLEKMDKDRRLKIFAAAEKFIDQVTD